MNWRIIADDWRLKLLALGLAVLMLGAVAFSQNPPTSATLTVGLGYPNSTNNPVVLINAPNNIRVRVSGLSNQIAIVRSENLTATVDISHLKPGPAQRLDVVVTATIHPLTVEQPAPIVVDVDSLTSKEVQLEVKASATPGWSITNTSATCPDSSKPSPCFVHFSGPAGWMNNLHAYVTYPAPVAANTGTSPNQPIVLQNSTGFVDYNSCGKILTPAPGCSLDATSASVHVDAVAGVTSSTVPLLDMAPTHGPASGYRITAIAITPNTVIISGDPGALGRIRSITLPAVDLTGRTSDATFQVNIPYPDRITGSVATATIKYSISPNPNVPPSP